VQTAKLWRDFALLLSLGASAACGGADSQPAPAATCDAACRDRGAARALRATIKVVYNLTLQGNAVGEQDESTRCPLGGRARVSGVATSLAEQGATELAISYELEECAYLQRDDDVEGNYDTVISGTVTEQGTLAVQPTATTALIFESDSISIVGTVYDPPADYAEPDCALRLVQSGNSFDGSLCGRKVGLDL
jgi:hypothetical protein